MELTTLILCDVYSPIIAVMGIENPLDLANKRLIAI